LRWRLGALVSRFGDRLASEPEAWRACELELSSFYSGPYAVRTYAIVQALKGGLVADLVTWHREGARGVEGELAQRLVERSGAARPIAEWAIAQWSFAFRLDDGAHAAAAAGATPVVDATPSAEYQTRARAGTQPPSPPAATGREMVVRVPHLVGAGIVAAAAVVAAFDTGVVPASRVAGLFGEAEASAPALPPAPALEGPPRRARQMSSAGDVVTPPTRRRDPPPVRRQGPSSSRAPSAVAPPAPDTPDTPRVSCAWDGGGPATARARLVRDYPPPFPRDLADAGMERGEAILRFEVDEEGRVRAGSIEVVGTTHPLFARSATEVAEQWRYRPARRDGCAVAATVMRTVAFRRD
jgi:protein TonB